MKELERDPKHWLTATVVSAGLHAGLVLAGQSGLDAEPDASGAGLGSIGELEVVALTPDQVDRLLARRGSVDVPLLAEAGGHGAFTERPPLLAPARPPGPNEVQLEEWSVLAIPGVDTGEVQALQPPAAVDRDLPGALPAPSVEPLEDLTDAVEAPGTSVDAESAGDVGSEDAGASARDGDRADGLDANRSNAYVLQQFAPDYPPELEARDRAAGITSRYGVLECRVSERGRVQTVRLVVSTGDRGLDAKALAALKEWRFDADALRADGLIGEPLEVEVRVSGRRR